ncbi:hypothetical protein E3O42_10205 [Cryobacterium adonitolivorans]|uniref:Resolvase/invertase-type recombinase catalytic domain-containing protein n=1 Tax=Cryobacterium adonitolivorans TaxID=1259189 RepID=A0A4R8W3G0_9MICO|nr:hypothetical protein E3O42_10205 [Cryobacterium adonitolivorans]
MSPAWAKVSEFESELIRSRTREGMAVAREEGRLRGCGPKLSSAQEIAWSNCTPPAGTRSRSTITQLP